jgi:hypothetical protein
MLILDEADEMLNKGFKEQIYDIYRYLPPNAQVLTYLLLLEYWNNTNENVEIGHSFECHSSS